MVQTFCNSQGVYKNGSNILSEMNQSIDNLLNSKKGVVKVDEVKIYPNPASNTVTISYAIQQNEKASLTLYDIVGNEVRQVDLSSQNTNVSFSVADLITGVYIYKYEISGRVVSTGKLVIE